MSPRPHEVNVAGCPWSIEDGDLGHLGAVGYSDPSLHRITIHPGQTLRNEQDTVLHEVMHAVLRQQGRPYSAVEERYVTALATGLLGVLHDNPALTKYLMRKRR